MSAQPFVYIAPALLVILLLLAMQYDHHQAAVAKVQQTPVVHIILSDQYTKACENEGSLPEWQEGISHRLFDAKSLNPDNTSTEPVKNGSGSFESIDLTDTDSPAPAKKVRFLEPPTTAILSMDDSHNGAQSTMSVGY